MVDPYGKWRTALVAGSGDAPDRPIGSSEFSQRNPDRPPPITPPPRPANLTLKPKVDASPIVPAKPTPIAPTKTIVVSTVSAWEKKAIRGIYLSRYQVTNNASEKMIRDRSN